MPEQTVEYASVKQNAKKQVLAQQISMERAPGNQGSASQGLMSQEPISQGSMSQESVRQESISQESINRLAQILLALLEEKNLTLATAESLTGGLVCAHLVSIPGASNVLKGGVVAYAAHIKSDVLGVSTELIAERGTVDPKVATQMAQGVCRQLSADVGIATTGVAGPGFAEGKPAGTVYIAVAQNGDITWKKLELVGSRLEIREQTVVAVFELLIDLLRKTTLGQGRKKLN